MPRPPSTASSTAPTTSVPGVPRGSALGSGGASAGTRSTVTGRRIGSAAFCSASAIASAEDQRWSGPFWSARSITAATRRGSSGRSTDSGRCGCVEIDTISAGTVSPPNGSSPDSAWYSTAPSDQRSERASMRRPSACSGLMYSGVPSTAPTAVRCGLVSGTSSPATPKSSSLIWRLAVVGQEDVLGLEVAVHEARVVRGLQRGEQLEPELDHALRGELLVAYRLGERVAFEQLEHEVERAIVLAPAVEHLHDARVVDGRGGARLAQEALGGHLRAREARVHQLQGDAPVRELVLRHVHRAHAAGAEQAFDPVFAGDLLPDALFVLVLALGHPFSSLRQAAPARPEKSFDRSTEQRSVECRAFGSARVSRWHTATARRVVRPRRPSAMRIERCSAGQGRPRSGIASAAVPRTAGRP